MRPRLGVAALLLFILILNQAPVYAGHFFESQAVEDDSGDTFNFDRCFNDGVLEPQPMELDVQKVELVLSEHSGSGLVEMSLEVTLNAPPLPHMSYTVEFGLDTDSDPSTGASEPAAFYNGLGVDFDIGLEVQAGSIASTWVDMYEDGSWVRLGEAGGYVHDAKVVVYVPLDLIPHPLAAPGIVYLISGGGLDMVPGVRLIFYYTPEAALLSPHTVGEGSDCLLDASPSYSMYGIVLYEWDLDGDGVYDGSSGTPTFTALFPGEGEHVVTVRVTDALGITASHTRTVTVLNLPPVGLEAAYTGEAKVGNTLIFNASATDPGGDPLTYEWSFGDDATGAGAEVAHTYEGAGYHIVMVTVRDDAGAEATAVLTVDVAPATAQTTGNGGGGSGTPPLDPLPLVLVIAFGILGVFIYNALRGKKKEEKPPKKDEDKKEKGFCEEHPEVVEQETHDCEDALIDLESATGDVQDSFDEAEPRWRGNVNEIGRLLVQWDSVVSLIAYWTKTEKELQADAEKVQKVAGVVKSAGGAAKTAFKEGGEAAMREVGTGVAEDMAKSVAGELSSTVGDLLGLEDWAIREIGLGIAKGLTGVDPKGNAVKLRKSSEIMFEQLLSWVDHSEAWNLGRRPPDTLQSMAQEADGMLNALDDALKSFEAAVKGFRCVTCPIPDYLQDEMDELRGKLEKWKQTFSDLEKEVQKRLDQAKAMYRRKDLYESPYEYLDKASRNVERIDRAREGP